MHFRKSSLALGSTWQEADLRPRITKFVDALLSRRRRVIFFAAYIILSLGFISTVLPRHVMQAIWNALFSHSKSNDHNRLIANGTLGFEKIYTIGLPDRFDKRDAMELAADVTNLQLTWIDGVPGNLMSQKSVPPTFKLPGVLPGVIGCWRSHMNVVQKIVKEKISSALILEDDADWDLHIVWQMQQFATATRELLAKGGPQKKRDQPTNSPYGEGWDILWIGHCGGYHANTGSMPHYIIRNDQTVPPAMGMDDMLFGMWPDRPWNMTSPDTHCSAHVGRDPPGKKCNSPRLAPNERIVQERAKPVCTASYAISYQGARKLLARLGGLSLQDVFAPLDQGIGDLCSGRTDLSGEQVRCFTPSPPYIRGYKAKGPLSGDSDIRKTGAHGEKRDVGWSKGILWSTRLNANDIAFGVGLEPESQYVMEGPDGEEKWRYRKANEYRSFRQEIVVDKWDWI